MKHLFEHNDKVIALCSEHTDLAYRFFVDQAGAIVDVTEALWLELHDELSSYCAIAEREGSKFIVAQLRRMTAEVSDLVQDDPDWVQPVSHIQILMNGRHEWYTGAVRVVSFDRPGMKVV